MMATTKSVDSSCKDIQNVVTSTRKQDSSGESRVSDTHLEYTTEGEERNFEMESIQPWDGRPPCTRAEFRARCNAFLDTGNVPDSDFLSFFPEDWLSEVPVLFALIEFRKAVALCLARDVGGLANGDQLADRIEELLQDFKSERFGSKAEAIIDQIAVDFCRTQARIASNARHSDLRKSFSQRFPK